MRRPRRKASSFGSRGDKYASEFFTAVKTTAVVALSEDGSHDREVSQVALTCFG